MKLEWEAIPSKRFPGEITNWRAPRPSRSKYMSAFVYVWRRTDKSWSSSEIFGTLFATDDEAKSATEDYLQIRDVVLRLQGEHR